MKEEINIQNLIEKIDKEIIENGYQDDSVEFRELDDHIFIPPLFKMKILEEEIQMANENSFIDLDVEIRTNWWKKTIKKILKKIMYFQLKPMVNDQNLFNMNLVNIVNQMYSYILDNEKKTICLEKKLMEVMNENEKLICKIKEIEDRL